MLKRLIGICTVGLLFIMGSFSVAGAMGLAEGLITTAVVNREPVDAIQNYPSTVDHLYCFTRVTGAAQGEVVTHLWRYEGREMARVDLLIGGESWRTWSSKTFHSEWKGSWQVDILGEDGVLLMSIPFQLI